MNVYGKYRGTVANNIDPNRLARVQVSVPAILGDTSIWAMPCVPYAGPGVGFLAIPPVGACVWVEFEGGDPGLPIWSGCFWASDQIPDEVAPTDKLFKSAACTIHLRDAAGEEGIMIETVHGARISIDQLRIEIDNGNGVTLALEGPTVTVNGRAVQ